MKTESHVRPSAPFQRIVIPHDLTVRSDKAMEFAGTVAHPFQSEIVLINVIEPTEQPAHEHLHFISQVGDMARDRWRFLQIAAKRLLPDNVKFDVRILSGDPQDAILAEAKKIGADLLIVTTHPLTGAGYPFHGEKAQDIMHRASCPVLTIQVSEEDEASLAEKEMEKFKTHNLSQYCEVSRELSKTGSHRPVYLGYSTLPANPAGVCDKDDS
jgi:nucleotide-binding universal stress UspA family protein